MYIHIEPYIGIYSNEHITIHMIHSQENDDQIELIIETARIQK